MEHKPSFCIKRKREIDIVKTENFLKDSADSDDETPLSDVFDWMDPVPIKRSTIALEDSSSKRKRLKEEGTIHAENGRFWEAISKWEIALSLSQFGQFYCRLRGTVANGGDEEKGKDDKNKHRREQAPSYDSSEERLLDAELFEMKAQALMELDEVFPAVESAEGAVLSNPTWHIGWQTLGRAQLGFGDIDMAIRSFSKAVHIKPDEEELWKQDLKWAIELKDERTKSEASSDSKCERHACCKEAE